MCDPLRAQNSFGQCLMQPEDPCRVIVRQRGIIHLTCREVISGDLTYTDSHEGGPQLCEQ